MTTFIFSIDDAGSGGRDMVEALRRASGFFESREVRATWFVVPKAGGRPMTQEWRTALLEARDAGHDIQLHGLTHADCYEFGPPAWPATNVVPDFVTDFEARRDELMPRYTVERLQARIEEGLEVFDQVLGIEPTAFRAPCGAISKPLYEALAAVGIGYESCLYLSAVGYEHLPHRSGDLSQSWRDDIPHRPWRWYSGVVQAPILNEYTWRGASQRAEDFLKLAEADVARIAGTSPVAVLLMHTHGIADDYDYTFRLIDQVVTQVRDNGLGRFSTFKEAIAAGELAAAATVDGPDLLAV